MSRASAEVELVIGGEPRVDLMPLEIKSRQQLRVLRRGLAAAVAAVIVLVGAGVAAANWQASRSQTQLATAQERTAELLSAQIEFVEVREVQNDLATSIAARRVGSSTEVDWEAYLQEVRAVLPADVTIDTVDVDSASPLVLYAQPTVPLQSARMATIILSMTSPGLPPVPEWLEAMEQLPGFADATPSSITRSATGAYLVQVTLHINEGAYSNRFADAASTEEK